jgi:tRNA threonylcarbamoyladenosine biosynthesis protein TsaE
VLKLSLADLTDTRRFAVVFAAMLRNGDVVLLDGEMGAGKTTTTKLIAEAIGVVDDVTSPTYTLVHTYSGGRLTLHHADLYRLKSTAEIDDLGLEEMLSAGGVLLIEWGAPAGELFPAHVFVSLSIDDETGRTVTLGSRSEIWASRLKQLETNLQDLVV